MNKLHTLWKFVYIRLTAFLLHFVCEKSTQQLYFNLILGSYTLQTELKHIVHLTTQNEESEID